MNYGITERVLHPQNLEISSFWYLKMILRKSDIFLKWKEIAPCDLVNFMPIFRDLFFTQCRGIRYLRKCVCVCTYKWKCVSTYILERIYMYILVCVLIEYICVAIYLLFCLFMHLHINISISLHAWVCVCEYEYVLVCLHLCIYKYVCACVYKIVHILCVYVCICIFVYSLHLGITFHVWEHVCIHICLFILSIDDFKISSYLRSLKFFKLFKFKLSTLNNELRIYSFTKTLIYLVGILSSNWSPSISGK